MSLFSKLFRGGPDPKAVPEEYQGFRIYAEPMKDPGGFRVSARIEKGEGDAMRSHRLIRADTCATEDEAVEFSLTKAKQLIDQQGDRLFD